MVKAVGKYMLKKLIGQGRYGKVFYSTCSEDQKQYAIKQIPMRFVQQNVKLLQRIKKQKVILNNLAPNKYVIKQYGLLQTKNNLYVVYQYCNGDTLESMIRRQGKISEEKALHIFKQLFQGLKILREYSATCINIKPSSILFHNESVKIHNVGFCKDEKPNQQDFYINLGYFLFNAPELLKYQQFCNTTNIWHLGVLLYYMLFSVYPIPSYKFSLFICNQVPLSLNFPYQVSSFTSNLLKRMIVKNPQKRIGWIQISLMMANISSVSFLEKQASLLIVGVSFIQNIINSQFKDRLKIGNFLLEKMIKSLIQFKDNIGKQQEQKILIAMLRQIKEQKKSLQKMIKGQQQSKQYNDCMVLDVIRNQIVNFINESQRWNEEKNKKIMIEEIMKLLHH